MTPDRRVFGLLLVGGATALWSTAGIFVRLVDLDVWTILGWRSVFAVLALLVIVMLKRRSGAPPSIAPRPVLWLTVPVATISMGAYVIALKLTTVANVMVVYAAVPFVTAVLAWVIIGERITGRMLAASLAAIVGVAIMAGAALEPASFLGVSVALLMTVAMGTQIVLARKYPGLDMALVNAMAAAVCAMAGLVLAGFPMPTPYELFVLALFGISNTALAYYLVLVGARYIPAAEAGLISTLDVVLGPVWVWLIFAEVPSRAALIGGAIVLTAVTYYLLAVAKPDDAGKPDFHPQD
ncbi:DMT family transporter [Aestuariivirga sp.]|uniref:DMT family transporter n=1 Tax=Aestuariivirga sp. TaxID=2650926 RepID=UPI003019D9A2